MPTFEEQIDLIRQTLNAVQNKLRQMQDVLKTVKKGTIMEGVPYNAAQKTELKNKYLALKDEAEELWTEIP